MRRVLIVDDDPITRLNLSLILSDAGYEVIGEAADGFDAIEFCRKKQADLVLMDIKMEVFDGLSAAEKICGEQLAGCVVMLTAFADEQFISRANEIGVGGYLVKPIDPRNLLPTLEVALAQSARLAQAKQQAEDSLADLEQRRTVEIARGLLAKNEQISEQEAYRKLQKMAMDKRISLGSLAQAVIEQNAGRDTVNTAKGIIMRQYELNEKAAYKQLQMLAAKQNVTLEAISRAIIKQAKDKP